MEYLLLDESQIVLERVEPYEGKLSCTVEISVMKSLYPTRSVMHQKLSTSQRCTMLVTSENNQSGSHMNSQLTKYAFLAGVAYFCCMAIAHYFGIKVPILFVYYNTPFYAYQDKIISFAICAYIALFYSAAQHRSIALNAIIVLAITVLGLSSVNTSDALTSVLQKGQSTLPYWLQTGAILFYLIILIALYVKDGKNS